MARREVWRPAVGYRGLYEVSDSGRIRSLRSGRMMKQTLSGTTGYLVLNLCRPGAQKLHRVHQVVARAFLGRQRPGMEVDHVNAVKTDNRVSNLEYVTPQENDRRATAMGLKASGDRNGSRTHPERRSRGEHHYAAKLSQRDVTAIRRLVANGVTQRAAAARYGVTPSHVSRIISGCVRKAG